jgi:hypothetical protein
MACTYMVSLSYNRHSCCVLIINYFAAGDWSVHTPAYKVHVSGLEIEGITFQSVIPSIDVINNQSRETFIA